MDKKLETILWSIAIPGFGQLLNRRYVKGLLLILLEFVINVNAHLNHAIVLSALGDMEGALSATNIQWLMFYPCVYMFGIWDAYRDADGTPAPFAYLAFVLPAYLGTVGIMYSPKIRIMGHLIGPVLLPLLFASAGVFVGWLLQRIIRARGNAVS